MYAKKITLIGNEAGLGVRNAGSIGASAGNLVVTAAGRLENTGTLEGQSVQLSSTGSDFDNRGGTIRQTSTASLAIAAPTLSNTNGGWIGTEPLSTGSGAGTGTTGSMGGLIEGAKQKIWSISNQIAGGKPAPQLKIGLVAYRDRKDAYVTKVFDLTEDLDRAEADVGDDGPGDEDRPAVPD